MMKVFTLLFGVAVSQYDAYFYDWSLVPTDKEMFPTEEKTSTAEVKSTQAMVSTQKMVTTSPKTTSPKTVAVVVTIKPNSLKKMDVVHNNVSLVFPDYESVDEYSDYRFLDWPTSTIASTPGVSVPPFNVELKFPDGSVLKAYLPEFIVTIIVIAGLVCSVGVAICRRHGHCHFPTCGNLNGESGNPNVTGTSFLLDSIANTPGRIVRNQNHHGNQPRHSTTVMSVTETRVATPHNRRKVDNSQVDTAQLDNDQEKGNAQVDGDQVEEDTAMNLTPRVTKTSSDPGMTEPILANVQTGVSELGI